MTIKPIRTEEDYEAACARIDEIFQAEPGSPEEEELEVLVTLVDDYERRSFPVDMPHPIDAVTIQMQNLNVTRRDLMVLLGRSSGRVSDLLNCRRHMTLNDIRILSEQLHLPLEVLTQKYPVCSASRSVARGAADCNVC